MATVPALVYFSRPASRATASVNSDENLLSGNLGSGEDDNLDESTSGMQPGVWWKDKNKWVMYDKKLTTRITKAAEIGLLKVKFNRAEAAAYSQLAPVTGPSRSKHPEIKDVAYHQRSYSSDSSSSSVGSPEYEVDLIEMKEVHLQSGMMRDIKIVKELTTGCVFRIMSASNDSNESFSIHVKQYTKPATKTSIETTKLRISRKDDTQGWITYNNDCQRAIWSAWTQGYNVLSILTKSKKYPDGKQYIIDLQAMQQENVITRHRRPIQIAVWMSSSKFPHMWIGDDSKYLAREVGDVGSAENETMVYKLALSRLLCPENVKRAISENMAPQTLQSMEMSSHDDLATHGLWTGFLNSFMQTVKELPDYYGHLWRFALNPDGRHHPENPFTPRNSNALWRFVFGAPSHGRDSDISLRSSTKNLPTKYRTYIDWFGLTSAIAEFHCKPVSHGVVTMLIFLVLMPKNFDDSTERVVFIRKVKDHLPVASITVSIDDSTLGPACSLWQEKSEENRPNSSSSEGYLTPAYTDTPMPGRATFLGVMEDPRDGTFRE